MRRLRELSAYRDRAQEKSVLARYRALGLPFLCHRDLGGCFIIPRYGVELRVIAGSGDGWDHVSVSTNLPRTPSWAEMEHVKRLFFEDHETAMQLHVPPADHLSHHDYVLHLWRPHDVDIPRPPADMV